MALSTYAGLKTAIGEWTFAAGASLLNFYDDFIDLAEARFNYGSRGAFPTEALRTAAMEATANLTLDVNGEATLPADYLESRGFEAQHAMLQGLAPTTPDGLSYTYPTTYGGIANRYTISAGKVRVRPTTTDTVRLVYYAKIPALSDAVTTNWLLTAYPNVYLYGTCLEAAIFQGDTGRATEMATLLSGHLSGFAASDKAARWSRGVARVVGATP